MNIISIVNTKGGVGKTITSVHLGAALAASGARVLLLDCDLQHGLTSYFDAEPGALTMSDVLKQTATLRGAMVNVREGLYLVPATAQLADTEAALNGAPGAELRIRRAFRESGFSDDGGFDFALLDCPSGWGNVTRNALLASDAMLIPVNSEPAAALNAAATEGAAHELGTFHDHDIALLGVLLTCWRDTRVARAIADDCGEKWGDVVFSTRIRRAEKINELAIRRETLAESAKSAVGEDYGHLALEVLQRTKGAK